MELCKSISVMILVCRLYLPKHFLRFSVKYKIKIYDKQTDKKDENKIRIKLHNARKRFINVNYL